MASLCPYPCRAAACPHIFAVMRITCHCAHWHEDKKHHPWCKQCQSTGRLWDSTTNMSGYVREYNSLPADNPDGNFRLHGSNNPYNWTIDTTIWYLFIWYCDPSCSDWATSVKDCTASQGRVANGSIAADIGRISWRMADRADWTVVAPGIKVLQRWTGKQAQSCF